MPAAAAARAGGEKRNRVGRPPRVDSASIVAAAIALGLENVTLRAVAARLGVGVATLYRHVGSREELVRRAAFQLTLDRAPLDAGARHWSELARRYAQGLYASFLAEPQLIGELLAGRLGPHAEVDILESFLDALAAQGFDEHEGVQLFHAIGMVTIGAAAGAIGLAASRAAGRPWSHELRRTLAARDRAALPRVRRQLPPTLGAERIPWLPTLDRLLAGIAQARGETLAVDADPAVPSPRCAASLTRPRVESAP